MPKAAEAPSSTLGLRRIRLLEGLAPDALQALAQQCAWRRYRPDQRVISRQAADQDVYLIVSGSVRVTAYSGSGKQVTFRDIAAGETFGELAALDGRPRSADVVALEETLVASLNPAAFRALLHDHPAVCDRMLARLTTSVRELTERVFDLSTLGVQNRVHAELLRLAQLAGIDRNVARIDPAPKHSDIASHVSTYREQVTREISALVKRGLVQRSGGALVIPDVARLARMVAEVRRSA
ncbi:MAG TPA: Crp/Fnr family transcriptional regulator [Burkholderiales bacterium]|nr:Crp/Fnr family transcriptional regulator [Burkholderiales bacterium]